MKTQKNILAAFVLNLAFAVFEFVGGIRSQGYMQRSSGLLT